MGLLQDPITSLEQIEWYLTNEDLERFPGAFELAAGNLGRQVLEQILFILCFYGGVQKPSFVRQDMRLHTAGRMIHALDRRNRHHGVTYWETARRRSPRIRKFARYPRSLKKWQKLLNEPSHFSAGFRKVSGEKIQSFVDQVSPWFDEKDKHLIICAINELHSRGKIKAIITDDNEYTPGVRLKVVVSAANLHVDEEGQLGLLGPRGYIYVAPDSEVPRGPWPGKLLLIQGYHGFTIQQQFLTKKGYPVDIRNFETILKSFSRSKGERSYLTRRIRELGLDIQYLRDN